MRHWKQKWDPNADLVFAKRLKLGLDPENPWVEPGDPVPKCRRHKARIVENERRVKSDGQYLGIHRLYMWFRAGIVELADFEYVDVAAHKARGVELANTEPIPPEPIPPGGYPPVEPGNIHPGVRKPKRLKDSEVARVKTNREFLDALVEKAKEAGFKVIPAVEPLGAGWYKIAMPDGGSCKVRGKAKLEAKLAELAG